MDIGSGGVGFRHHGGQLRHVIRVTLTCDEHGYVRSKLFGGGHERLESFVRPQISEEGKTGLEIDSQRLAHVVATRTARGEFKRYRGDDRDFCHSEEFGYLLGAMR